MTLWEGSWKNAQRLVKVANKSFQSRSASCPVFPPIISILDLGRCPSDQTANSLGKFTGLLYHTPESGLQLPLLGLIHIPIAHPDSRLEGRGQGFTPPGVRVCVEGGIGVVAREVSS